MFQADAFARRRLSGDGEMRFLNPQPALQGDESAHAKHHRARAFLINRRALLVAGLLYALIAAGYLISKVGLSGGWTAAVTLLVMGGAMVLLGGGWHALRRVVVAPFPKTGPIARIIPPEPSKADRRRVSE